MFNKKKEKEYTENLTEIAKMIGAGFEDEGKDTVFSDKRIQNKTLADELDKTNKRLDAILTHLNLRYTENEVVKAPVKRKSKYLY